MFLMRISVFNRPALLQGCREAGKSIIQDETQTIDLGDAFLSMEVSLYLSFPACDI
jgi:hypothetical protein